MYDPNRPIQVGDKVLVKATVTEIDGDDPHDPVVTVWFNGQAHTTTVMNVRRDTEGQPIYRDMEKMPIIEPTPRTRSSLDHKELPGIDEALDLVADARPEAESIYFDAPGGRRQHGIVGPQGFVKFEPGDFTGKSVGEDPDE
jgi:hypothetical protein